MRAIYDGIYRDLHERIVKGEYAYQTLMPSESELVREFGCSHNTIRRALTMLADEGFVQPIHGKGVRVIRGPLRRTAFTFGGIESYAESARNAHLNTTTEVIVFERLDADRSLSEATGFDKGEPLWHVERVRTIDGRRLIRDVNYFSVEHVPALSKEIAQGSIYAYLEGELGLVIAVANRVLTVERTTPADRACLDMDGYGSLAVVTGQMYTQEGIHVESTQSRHRQDYFSFSYTARRNR